MGIYHDEMLKHRRPIVLAIAATLVLGGCDWGESGQPNDDIAGLPAHPTFKKAPPPSPTGFVQPIRIASARHGHLLVSDAKTRTVLAVSMETMQPMTALEIRGQPLAVGMQGNRIFVGNATAQRVEVYDSKGRFKYFFKSPVKYPTDLAIDATAGLVFVVDGLEHDVKVFDINGELLGTISGPNTVPAGQLHNPTGIAVDLVREQILVSDYPDPLVGGAGSIKIFDYQGSLVTTLTPGGCGWFGGCSGGFSRPQGIAFDGDRIFVVDAFQALILVYDRVTLALITEMGGPDAGLRVPMDLAIDGGDIFVTSSRTSSVEVFRGGAAFQ